MSGPLAGTTVMLGVTGSIAAFKAPHIVTRLASLGANVVVVMTENATRFVAPLTFETLSGNETIVSMWPREREGIRGAEEAARSAERLEHVHLGQAAGLVIIAPATANIIGKMAGGIADDFLSTELMVVRCPIVVAPAMNDAMYESGAVRENIATLRERGVNVLEPEAGRLASGSVGTGRLADPDRIVDAALDMVLPPRDLAGRRVVVTAGPTEEPIDPVRHIGNRSTGKMGYAIAERALRRGADVVLISGPTQLAAPAGVATIDVRTTREMLDAVVAHADALDLLVMAAAPADYRPAAPAERKIKKSSDRLTLELVRTEDIISEVRGRIGERSGVVGFALETEDEIENAREKLRGKNLDVVVANNATVEGAGFAGDTNVATVLTKSGRTERLPLMAKAELADVVLSVTIEELGWKGG